MKRLGKRRLGPSSILRTIGTQGIVFRSARASVDGCRSYHPVRTYLTGGCGLAFNLLDIDGLFVNIAR